VIVRQTSPAKMAAAAALPRWNQMASARRGPVTTKNSSRISATASAATNSAPLGATAGAAAGAGVSRFSVSYAVRAAAAAPATAPATTMAHPVGVCSSWWSMPLAARTVDHSSARRLLALTATTVSDDCPSIAVSSAM
jgi:hypothetical protein